MREQIISSHLPGMEIYEIIGHDLLVYLKIGLAYSVALIAGYGVFWVVHNYIPGINRSLGFGIYGAGVYLKAMYDLADEYLDALVVTNLGLVLFRWNGLFNYKTVNLQRVGIESISEQQNSVRDRIFHKGDLVIRSEDERYTFTDIEKPSQQISGLITRKNKILGRDQYSAENELETDSSDKYELLVEALGEVVSEYVEKKHNH